MKIRGKLHGNYMLKQLPVRMASIRQDGIILLILFIQRAARCSLYLRPDGFLLSTQCVFSPQRSGGFLSKLVST